MPRRDFSYLRPTPFEIMSYPPGSVIIYECREYPTRVLMGRIENSATNTGAKIKLQQIMLIDYSKHLTLDVCKGIRVTILKSGRSERLRTPKPKKKATCKHKNQLAYAATGPRAGLCVSCYNKEKYKLRK